MLARFRSVVIAGLLLGAVPGPAMSDVADANADAGSAGVAFHAAGDWRGPYVGIGYGVGNVTGNGRYDFAGREYAPSTNVFAGYTWQSGRAVAGIEAGTEHDRVAGRSWSARARLGLAAGDALLFVSAGVVTTKDIGPTVGYLSGNLEFDGEVTVKGRLTGLSLSAGTEHKLGPALALRTEIARHDYGARSFHFPARGPFTSVDVPGRFDAWHMRAALVVTPFAPPERGAAEFADWSGHYAGLMVARSLTNIEPGFQNPFRNSPAPPRLSPLSTWVENVAETDRRGLAAHYGMQRQFGRIVLGGEIDASIGDADLLSGSLRARLGYAFRRSMLYATAGWGVSDYALRDTYDDQVLVRRHVGPVVGAGIESRLNERLSLKIEGMWAMSRPATYDFQGLAFGRATLGQKHKSPSITTGFETGTLRMGLSAKLP